MSSESRSTTLDRRHFLRSTGGAVAATALLGARAAQAQAAPATKPEPISVGSAFRPLTDAEKVARIAANSYLCASCSRYATAPTPSRQTRPSCSR